MSVSSLGRSWALLPSISPDCEYCDRSDRDSCQSEALCVTGQGEKTQGSYEEVMQ